jgi:hypothetical protein
LKKKNKNERKKKLNEREEKIKGKKRVFVDEVT